MSGRTPPTAFRPLNVADRWDSEAIAASLSQDHLLACCAAALDLVAAWACSEVDEIRDDGVRSPIGRAGQRAEHEAVELLLDTVVEIVPREDMFAPNGQPRIPLSLGRICERCGCSENDACEDGCGWVTDRVCSHCAAPWEITAHG